MTMSRCSASPPVRDAVKTDAEFRSGSRRHFLRQLLGAGALAVTGLDSLLAQNTSPIQAGAFRFAFLTDLHLMPDGAVRSADGIAACLAAVEKLDPRPDFILVGGDLVHFARERTIRQGESDLDFFLKVWNGATSLPTHWTFGNHDLVSTSNLTASPTDKHYGKGLFRERFQLPQLFYSFDWKGWHFVILDDIALQPDHTYIGKLFDDELQFLQADLDAHRTQPTIVCTHIPPVSNLPLGLLMAHANPTHHGALPKNLVCSNGEELVATVPGHAIRAVLAGHLHYLERIDLNGIPYINSGAVCGSYWKGPLYGCAEGFGVVDVTGDGSVAFDYRTFGWKAV